MSGIEQAFKDFVKRVSEKENQEQVSEERGYQYGGGAIGFSGGGYPPVEEDNQSVEYGQDIRTIPTGFNFAVNRPMPVYQEGQPQISGGLRDLRNYVNTNMGNISPQLSYVGDNFGGNVSAMMNPSINAPKSYSANAYYGSEQDRLNFGINTIPTAGAKQIMIGREGPYGNISLGASRDPSGNNYSLNYSNSFADGGRAGYADGAGPIPLGLVDYKGTPWENSFKPLSQPQPQPQPKLIKMGLLFNPDGSYPGENMPNPIQELQITPTQTPTGKVLKPEYQNGIPLGLPMDSYFMDAPITSTQTPTQNTTSNLPSDLSIDQIQSLSPRDRIIRALKLAGFSSSDVDSILAKQGFANGGKVNTDLTRTIPPDSGPNPQGVETLFKRRYN